MAWTAGGSTGAIIVNGSSRSIDPSASFVETVKRYAQEAGLGKFRVFVNDNEIDPSDAPEQIGSNRVEIRPYEVAGQIFLM